MASTLAPVYLDDARVTLQGDPRPQVAKILQAGGQAAEEGLVVVRLREAAGADGQPVGLSEVIDREKAATPVYLRVVKANTSAPGDIARGTGAVPPASSPAPGGPQAFAQSQSFGDPVHKGGSPRVAPGSRPSSGLRTQETSQEEGAGGTAPDDLGQASEEEE